MSYNSGSNRARNFKLASRFALGRFRNYLPDYSLNCTPLGPITITYYYYYCYSSNINFIYFSVKYPTAISTVIDADYHQKVVMKFSLKSESSGDLFTPHQAFVRLTNEKTKQEIFFVTEPEPSKVFKFDLVSLLALYSN